MKVLCYHDTREICAHDIKSYLDQLNVIAWKTILFQIVLKFTYESNEFCNTKSLCYVIIAESPLPL